MSNLIKNIEGVFDHSTLGSQLRGYKNLNDKIYRMVESGDILALKKGWYIKAVDLEKGLISKGLIANAIYGPSYVSFYSALSYYGLIPERVVLTESATVKRSTTIENKLGTFNYYKLPESSFFIGISTITYQNIHYMMASPTKALIDVLWLEKIRNIYSIESLHRYLNFDLRIDDIDIAELDIEIIESCIKKGKRKLLLKLLLNLCNNINK